MPNLHLIGEHTELIPLKLMHKDALQQAASDGHLWRIPYTSVPHPEHTHDYISEALQQQTLGESIPFAVVDKQSNQVIGTTRYYGIEPAHKRLKIGYTWYAQSFQRSAVNTESKYLLLQHAFEQMQCIATVFETNFHNKKSQAAIERLGAKRDGILRNHIIQPDGVIRDTVVYSIIQNEWSSVKQNLAFLMQKYKP